MDRVQRDQKLVNAIASGIDTADIRTKTTVLEMLAAICIIPPNGHRSVLTALTRFKETKGEWLRFTSIVDSLKNEVNYDYLITCMSLINSIVNFPKETEIRVGLRNEFIRLGILDIISNFKANYEHDEELEVHINIFDDFMKADAIEVNKHLSSLEGIDMNDPSDIFEAMKKKISVCKLDNLPS